MVKLAFIESAKRKAKKAKKKNGGTQTLVQAGSGLQIRRRPRQQFGMPTANTTVPRVRLDPGGLRYAKLLSDPCSGPLVNGPQPGLGGGIVTRFESETTIFSGALAAGGYLYWLPNQAAYTVSTTLTPAIASAGSAPTPSAGSGFLVSNAASYRCLSACMQIYWAGTELNRQGFVGMGYSTGGQYTEVIPILNGGEGQSISVDQVRASQFHVERMPNGMVEIKWKPSQRDMEWTSRRNGTANSLQAEVDSMTAISLSVDNLAAGAGNPGVRVRFVAVYEWIPGPTSVGGNQGLVTTTGGPPSTYNSINEVLQYLERTGRWFLKTAWDNREHLAEFAGAVGALTMM